MADRRSRSLSVVAVCHTRAARGGRESGRPELRLTLVLWDIRGRECRSRWRTPPRNVLAMLSERERGSIAMLRVCFVLSLSLSNVGLQALLGMFQT